MDEYEKLYREYYKDVFLYLRSLTRDETLSEDLTAETFLKAFEKIGSFRGDCDIRVWLCQIAKNLYLKHLKKNKRVQYITEEDLINHEEECDLIETRLIDNEIAVRIHQFLHDMKEPYKEVFTLRVFGELSFKMIGELFDKTEGWARVTYLRAKRQLQKLMEEM